MKYFFIYFFISSFKYREVINFNLIRKKNVFFLSRGDIEETLVFQCKI